MDSMIVSTKTQLPLALDGRQTRGPGAAGAAGTGTHGILAHWRSLTQEHVYLVTPGPDCTLLDNSLPGQHSNSLDSEPRDL